MVMIGVGNSMKVYELDYRGSQTLHSTMLKLLGYLFVADDYKEVEAWETAYYVGTVMSTGKDIILTRGEGTVATIKVREVM